MPEYTMTPEDRLRLLEEHVAVQEEILIGLQAERIEAERLNESVDRLGMGATSLGEALREVDRQQQLLTRLGRAVKEVQDKADEIDAKTLTTKDIEERERLAEIERLKREAEVEAERDRKAKVLAAQEQARRREQMRKFIWWSVLGAITVSAAVVAITVNNAAEQRENTKFRQDVYNICQARSEQARRVRGFLESAEPETAQEAERLQILIGAFPVIPCDGLLQ